MPGEWYFNASTGVLYVVPTADTVAAFDSNTVVAIAAVRPRVIQVRGSSPTTFAHDINIKGVTVMHSAPTFMADYEMPSGGRLPTTNCKLEALEAMLPAIYMYICIYI